MFGSFAREKQTEASDVDLVVEFNRPIGFKFVGFAEQLEKLLRRKVDILTPAGISGIRNRQIAENIAKTIIYV